MLLGAGCAPKTADLSTSSVDMSNHTLSKNNVFTIDSVVATQDGWVVIRNEVDAKPSEVLGYAPVKTGETKNINISINRDDATAQQYVSLYKDTGTIGTFETVESATSFVTDIKEEPATNKNGKLIHFKFFTEVE